MKRRTAGRPVVRVRRPAWASKPDVTLYSMRLSQYHEVQRHRAKIEELVHAAVEEYLNDPRLVCERSDEGFPAWDRLTGEYYLGDESYSGDVVPGVQISVMARCLEHRRPRVRDRDYLGLEVWLQYDPAKGTLRSHRSTDSSSI